MTSFVDAGHRARIEAAINFEKPDRTPYNNFSDIVTVRSAGMQIKDARFNAAASTKCAIRYSELSGTDLVIPVLDTNIQFMDVKTPRKVELTVPDDNYTLIRNKIASTPEDIEALEFYDPFNSSECPNFMNCHIRNIEDLAANITEDWHIFGFCWAPLSTAGFLMGAEDMMMNIILEPELVEKLLKKTTDWGIQLQNRCIDAGATVFWSADPTAGEDLIDADTFGKLEKPCMKRMIAGVKKEHPEAPILFHMCGYTANTLKHLPECKVDCFSFDIKTGVAEALKNADGKMSVMGNISPVGNLLNGTPEDVYQEAMACLETAGDNYGYMVSTGCEVPRDTPDENVIAIKRAIADYCRN